MDAAYAQKQLTEALHGAVAHLRKQGDFHFHNDEPEIFTTFQLAALIEELANRLKAGDKTVGKHLWRIFAVTSTWDDAGGDSRMGQDVFELIDVLCHPV